MTVAFVAAGAVAFVLGLAVGLRNWRWSVYGLILYIPVSGIAIVAAHGDRFERAEAVLAKDFLFVLPAYLGFLVSYLRGRERRLLFPGAPLVAALLLGAVVVVQAFNPELPNRLVGLIGVKVWLLYIPLLVLGYHLVRSRDELSRVLGVAAASAVLPAAVGIAEAIVMYTGDAERVWSLYGDAAPAVTQQFTEFPLGSGLRRIPSTFSSFYQYFLFLSTMVAVVYAWWRGRRAAAPVWSLPALLWLALVAATFASGQRGAFLFIPLLVAMILLLDRQRRLALQVAVPILAAFLLVVTLVGTNPVSLFDHLAWTARSEFGDVLVDGTHDAVATTTFGLGAGSDSIGARYAFPGERVVTPAGRFLESWYHKGWIELGVVGFLLVLVLFGTLVIRLVRSYASVRDPGLRSVAAAFLALLLWTLFYNVKAQYIDVDPLNVYFWLLAGLLFKLPALERLETAPGPERGTVDDVPATDVGSAPTLAAPRARGA